MYKRISIKDNNFDLEILISILLEVPNSEYFNWFLSEIEASGDLSSLETSMKKLSKECLDSKIGKKFSLKSILLILKNIDSLDNLLIITGNIEESKLNFEINTSLYQNVDYCFEYFDSSEWNITSRNINFIDKIIEKLKDNQIDKFDVSPHFNI